MDTDYTYIEIKSINLNWYTVCDEKLTINIHTKNI